MKHKNGSNTLPTFPFPFHKGENQGNDSRLLPNSSAYGTNQGKGSNSSASLFPRYRVNQVNGSKVSSLGPLRHGEKQLNGSKFLPNSPFYGTNQRNISKKTSASYFPLHQVNQENVSNASTSNNPREDKGNGSKNTPSNPPRYEKKQMNGSQISLTNQANGSIASASSPTLYGENQGTGSKDVSSNPPPPHGKNQGNGSDSLTRNSPPQARGCPSVSMQESEYGTIGVHGQVYYCICARNVYENSSSLQHYCNRIESKYNFCNFRSKNIPSKESLSSLASFRIIFLSSVAQ